MNEFVFRAPESGVIIFMKITIETVTSDIDHTFFLNPTPTCLSRSMPASIERRAKFKLPSGSSSNVLLAVGALKGKIAKRK